MLESKKIFVSYKYKDGNVQALPEYTPGEDTNYLYTPRHYVDKIIEMIGVDHIYKGEKSDDNASHLADDTIDSKLKAKIFDSSVTIVLISPNMWDRNTPEKEQWIPNEISYSLRNKTRNEKTSTTNAMLAVVIPDENGSYDYAVKKRECVTEWQTASYFEIIRKNMFNRIQKKQQPCETCYSSHHYGADHSFIHPVKWSDFNADHNKYIGRAVAIRELLDEFDITRTHE